MWSAIKSRLILYPATSVFSFVFLAILHVAWGHKDLGMTERLSNNNNKQVYYFCYVKHYG